MNRKIPLSHLILALILGLGVAGFDSSPAYAQAQTLGDMTNSVYDSLVSLQFFLSVLAYIIGTFFVATGILKLRDWVSDPGRNPASAALLRLFGASFFIFAPSAANMLVETLGAGGSGVGNDTNMTARDFVDIDSGTFAAGNGLESALGRFVADFAGPFLENLLPVFAYIAGLIFMFIGLKRLALANEDGPQAPGGMGTMGTFVVSAGLMAFGYVMYAMQGSIFGVTELFSNTLLRGDGDDEILQRANNALWAIFIFLRIVGYISVMRGLFLLRAAAEGGNASMTAVMTHMIAGSALANLGMFVDIIQRTFIDDEANYIFNPL